MELLLIKQKTPNKDGMPLAVLQVRNTLAERKAQRAAEIQEIRVADYFSGTERKIWRKLPPKGGVKSQ